MTDKVRLQWIDLAKGISILIVVMAHCYSLYPAYEDATLVVAGSLHNPVFYFCSGILLARKEEAYKAQGSRFAVKKFFDVLIPFFLWTALYAGVGACLLHRSILSAAVNAANQLWFLPVLFFAICVSILIFNVKKQHILIILDIVCMVAAAFFSSMAAKVFAYTAIVLAGFWIQKNTAKAKTIFLPAVVFWCLFTLAAVMTSYVTLEDSIKPGIKLLLVLWYDIAGAISVTYLVRSIVEKAKKAPKGLSYLGRNSLYVYILHYGILYIAEYLQVDETWQIGIVCVFCLLIPLLWEWVFGNTLFDKILFKPSLLRQAK